MKRFVAVLTGLLALPAFAEVAPIYYDEVIEYTDAVLGDGGDMGIDADMAESATPTTPVAAPRATVSTSRTATGRSISRAVPATGTTTVAPTRAVTSRGDTTRATTNSARTATTMASRGTTTRSTVSRAGATQNANVTTRRAGSTSAKATTARAGSSSIVQTNTASQPLYISSGTSSRVGVRNAITSRVPTIRMDTTTASTTSTSTSSTKTAADMDEMAQTLDFCKAQYAQCMDNFCNVLDENQGRCSCSKNLKNYAQTEAALKKATEDLQDVATKVQYLGLTSDQVESLFTQTEAELTMSQKSDNTQLKNDLDRIKNLIVDVKSGTASSTVDSGISMDLSGLFDISFSSTGFDLSTLFGSTGLTSNSSSISNQRGEQLYKTAAARCKSAVLNTCAAQGVDTSLITNAYDLEIDKACIAYERNLTDTNEQMASTVRNAQTVLQRARLTVAQKKNSYQTLRECVNALDSCMKDDFVCGSEYEGCLDPTGKFIINGEIVAGSTPGMPSAEDNNFYTTVWGYDNNTKTPWASNGSLTDYIESTLGSKRSDAKTDISAFLQSKIGNIDSNGDASGMCAYIFNMCQDYTYTKSGSTSKYNDKNQVLEEYLQRTLVQIKSKQDEILADYAEDCISDVNSCLTRNNYSYSWSSTTNSNIPSITAINACLPTIKTCANITGTNVDKWTTSTSSSADVKDWLENTLSINFRANAQTCSIDGKIYFPSSEKCITQAECTGTIGGQSISGICYCVNGASYDSTSGKCTSTTTVPSSTGSGSGDCAGWAWAASNGFDHVAGTCTYSSASVTQAECAAMTGVSGGYVSGWDAAGNVCKAIYQPSSN